MNNITYTATPTYQIATRLLSSMPPIGFCSANKRFFACASVLERVQCSIDGGEIDASEAINVIAAMQHANNDFHKAFGLVLLWATEGRSIVNTLGTDVLHIIYGLTDLPLRSKTKLVGSTPLQVEHLIGSIDQIRNKIVQDATEIVAPQVTGASPYSLFTCVADRDWVMGYVMGNVIWQASNHPTTNDATILLCFGRVCEEIFGLDIMKKNGPMFIEDAVQSKNAEQGIAAGKSDGSVLSSNDKLLNYILMEVGV